MILNQKLDKSKGVQVLQSIQVQNDILVEHSLGTFKLGFNKDGAFLQVNIDGQWVNQSNQYDNKIISEIKSINQEIKRQQQISLSQQQSIQQLQQQISKQLVQMNTLYSQMDKLQSNINTIEPTTPQKSAITVDDTLISSNLDTNTEPVINDHLVPIQQQEQTDNMYTLSAVPVSINLESTAVIQQYEGHITIQEQEQQEQQGQQCTVVPVNDIQPVEQQLVTLEQEQSKIAPVNDEKSYIQQEQQLIAVQEEQPHKQYRLTQQIGTPPTERCQSLDCKPLLDRQPLLDYKTLLVNDENSHIQQECPLIDIQIEPSQQLDQSIVEQYVIQTEQPQLIDVNTTVSVKISQDQNSYILTLKDIKILKQKPRILKCRHIKQYFDLRVIDMFDQVLTVQPEIKLKNKQTLFIIQALF